MTGSVGVVVPAYRPDVDRLASYVRTIDRRVSPATIRIEIDAPRSGVVADLDGLPAEVNAVPYRRGKGAAITAGFEALETDVLAFVDADGSTAADQFAKVLAPVREGTVPVAVGSRRHPESVVTSHQTLARRFMGDGFAWLARRMLAVDLYDYQCGAKALRADAWEAIRSHVYEAGFAWDVEVIAIAGALGIRVREVPIEWEDRPGSTVSPLRTALALGRALVRARHRAKRITNSRLHNAIAARRESEPALVDRE